MPVTIKPTSHKPSEIQGYNSKSAEELLQGSCSTEHRSCKVLLQSSLDFTSSNPLFAATNGFVRAAIKAYSSHHHLVIRPEDVWIAIITQFSVYVNSHAEELRGKFVSFEGKTELEITTLGDRWTVGFGYLALCMSNLLEKNVVDKELRDWIMPGFSTTKNDEMVAAIVMMSNLQKYFSYGMSLCCGLPSVTLLGERDDWVKLLSKIDKLKTFGEQPALWHQLLKPVLTGFVETFTDPSSEDVTTFWNRIAHYQPGGSGPSYYSGWITAFCFWDERGKMLYKPAATKCNRVGQPESAAADPYHPTLVGDIIYHRVDTNDVPVGYTSVPVKIDDNGKVFMSTMVAGSVGMRGSSSGEEVALQPWVRGNAQEDIQGEKTEAVKTGIDTLQPELGWFMFET